MNGALTGLKILDFSTLLPGPFATMNFADMGAEVLRVTTTARPDIMDVTPPLLPGQKFSAASAQVGRNKKTLTLNLKDPQAVEIVKKLIIEYDILVEQFRAGVMEKLGLGYETLSKLNPQLIYCSLTGYGQNGPLADRAGHDINYLALSGVLGYSGRRESGPSLYGIQIADLAAGSNNVMIGVLAAVICRHSTGIGQHVDVSMLDGVVAFNAMSGPGYLATGEAPPREGGMVNGGSLYDFYETKDGGFISFGGVEPKFWQDFCNTIGRPDWLKLGVMAGDKVKAELKGIIKTKTRDEWAALFKGADACLEPVLSLEEALGSEVVKARQMVVEVPTAEGGVLRQIGSPYKFSATPVQFRRAGRPATENDTVEVLKHIGYTQNEIDQMDANGVLK